MAELHLADEPRDREAQSNRSPGQLGAPLGVEELRLRDVALEVRDEARQHAQVLLGIEDLGHAVAVRDAEVPGWGRGRAGLVPFGLM